MLWPIETPPTWQERNTAGPQLTMLQAADYVADVSTDPIQWRHMHVLATMWMENQLTVWTRAMVWAPGEAKHLSVDRGICSLNSFYWARVPDIEAYDPIAAFAAVIGWLETEAAKGTKGASLWDWRPLLAWQWHGYQPESDEYKQALATARAAVNTVRLDRGITAL